MDTAAWLRRDPCTRLDSYFQLGQVKQQLDEAAFCGLFTCMRRLKYVHVYGTLCTSLQSLGRLNSYPLSGQ